MPTPGEGQLAADLCGGSGPVTAEAARTLAQVPATRPTRATERGDDGWLLVGLSGTAGIGVLAAAAWWLSRRRRRRTG